MRVGPSPAAPVPATSSPNALAETRDLRETAGVDGFGAEDLAALWARSEGREGLAPSGGESLAAPLLNSATLAHVAAPQRMVPLPGERGEQLQAPGPGPRASATISTQALLGGAPEPVPAQAQAVPSPYEAVPSKSELRTLVEKELGAEGLRQWDNADDGGRASLAALAVRSRLSRLEAPSPEELRSASGSSDERVSLYLPSLANIYANGDPALRVTLTREAMATSLAEREGAFGQWLALTTARASEPSPEATSEAQARWQGLFAATKENPDAPELSALTPRQQTLVRGIVDGLARPTGMIGVRLAPPPVDPAAPSAPPAVNRSFANAPASEDVHRLIVELGQTQSPADRLGLESWASANGADRGQRFEVEVQRVAHSLAGGAAAYAELPPGEQQRLFEQAGGLPSPVGRSFAAQLQLSRDTPARMAAVDRAGGPEAFARLSDVERVRALAREQVFDAMARTPGWSDLTPNDRAQRAWAYDLATEARAIAAVLPEPPPRRP